LWFDANWNVLISTTTKVKSKETKLVN